MESIGMERQPTSAFQKTPAQLRDTSPAHHLFNWRLCHWAPTSAGSSRENTKILHGFRPWPRCILPSWRRKDSSCRPVVPSISLARERQHRMVGNRASLRIKLPLLNCWLFCLLTGEATYSSGPSVFTSDKGNNNGILVRWGFHNNVSRIGWLTHQGFMFSQFWRLQD